MLKDLKTYIKPSISDNKGGLSSRKITALLAMIMLVLGYFMHIFKGTQIQPEFIWILGGIAGSNFGFLSWQNVIALKNGITT